MDYSQRVRAALALLLAACGAPAARSAPCPAETVAIPGTALCLDRGHVSVGAFAAWAAGQPPTRAERDGGAVFVVGEGFRIAPGASYRHPHGDGVAAPDDHPVTQITALEAEAFCRARGARLPTEDEWVRAARNGTDEPLRYPWGEAIVDARGAWRANVWQGTFPDANAMEDGYLFASPIGAFAPTPLGFVDLVGNVWHWTATSADDALAPSPALPGAEGPSRILRGGSFLCEAGRCHGYRIDARQRAEEDAALVHVGFRCIQSR